MHSFKRLAVMAVLAIVYFVSAKLGLMLAFVHPSATPVWPPTGIALAIFLLLGYRVWPGILLGAFLANITTAGSVATSIGIGMGNTLEGLVGAYLVNRFANGRNVFDRTQDIFKFAVLAGMVSTTVSATFGVTSLALGGFADWANYGPIWLTWWLGDAAGDFIIAPLVILWSKDPPLRWQWWQILEIVVLLLSLFLVAQSVFGGLLPFEMKNYPLEFACFPFLVWMAYRFGQREAATGIFMLSGVAIWGTLRGFGPFVRNTPNESLLLLQAFMGITAVMTVAMASMVSERKRAEEALRASERCLAGALDIAETAVISVDETQRIILFDPSAEKIFGYTVQEVLGRSLDLLLPSRFTEVHRQHIRDFSASPVAARRMGERQEVFGHRKDGTEFPAEAAIFKLNQKGQTTFTAVLRDITERKRAEETLEVRARQQAVVAVLGQRALVSPDLPTLMNEVVSLVAKTLEVEYCKILECLPDGKALLLRAGVGWKEGMVGRATVGAGQESQAGYALLSKQPVIVEDLRTETRFIGMPLLHDHGVVSGMSVIISGQTKPFGVLGAHTTQRRKFILDDVHFLQAVANVLATAIEHQRNEDKIRFLAYHDALTELPNRTLFYDRLQQAILSAQRNNETLALLILDLNRFKEINDHLGHHYGDLLLEQIGPRLRTVLRESDTIARLGGDEFAVLLPSVDLHGAVLTAQKILKRLKSHFVLEGQKLTVGTSIGIAIFPLHGSDVKTLMQHSDRAMYLAKQAGHGYVVYASEQKNSEPGFPD